MLYYKSLITNTILLIINIMRELGAAKQLGNSPCVAGDSAYNPGNGTNKHVFVASNSGLQATVKKGRDIVRVSFDYCGYDMS